MSYWNLVPFPTQFWFQYGTALQILTFAKKLINNYYTNNCDFVYSCIFPQLLPTIKQNLRNHFSDSIYLFKVKKH